MGSLIFLTRSISIIGGKETVLIDLANYLQQQKWQVEIAVYDGNLKPFKSLDPAIQISHFPVTYLETGKGLARRLAGIPADFLRTRRWLMKRQDAVVITTDHILTSLVYFAAPWLRNRLIAWEHLSYTRITRSYWKYLRRKVFAHIRAVVALNPAEQLFYKNLGANAELIPNAIEPRYQRPVPATNILCWLGALTYEKGVEDLVKLASFIKDNNWSVHIKVYGRGDKAGWLQAVIANEGLQEVISYKGIIVESEPAYIEAQALIVTSRHECFPTVILEAFSYGVPVISFDCPTGPATMIRHNENGYLVPLHDHAAMATCAHELLINPDKASAFSKEAFHAACAYLPAIVYKKWESLLAQ